MDQQNNFTTIHDSDTVSEQRLVHTIVVPFQLPDYCGYAIIVGTPSRYYTYTRLQEQQNNYLTSQRLCHQLNLRNDINLGDPTHQNVKRKMSKKCQEKCQKFTDFGWTDCAGQLRTDRFCNSQFQLQLINTTLCLTRRFADHQLGFGLHERL